MKIPVFAFPLVALWPACAQAQIQSLPPAPKPKATVPAGTPTEMQPAQIQSLPPAPKVAAPLGMQPAARALLDRATASYKGITGLRLGVSSTLKGKEVGSARVLLSKPRMLSVVRQNDKDTLRLLLNGPDFYVVQGTEYQKQKAPPASLTTLMQSAGGTSTQMIAAMIDGKNPIEVMQKEYARAPFQGFQGHTVALAPRLIDGDFYSGVQNTSTFNLKARDGSAHGYSNQVTAWFGGTPFALRRVQTQYSVDGKVINLSEKVFEQEFSPTFEEDTFKFNDSGLKPTGNEKGRAK